MLLFKIMFILLFSSLVFFSNTISSIRTHTYKHKTRIVFDFNDDFNFYYYSHNNKLTIKLKDSNITNPNIINKNLKNIKDFKLSNYFYLEQEKEFIIEIVFNYKLFIELFSLNEPYRLVLDLYFKENKL